MGARCGQNPVKTAQTPDKTRDKIMASRRRITFKIGPEATEPRIPPAIPSEINKVVNQRRLHVKLNSVDIVWYSSKYPNFSSLYVHE